MTRADCPFCRIAAGELAADVVHQTPRIVAFRDAAPAAPTHVLVVPREHFPDLADLSAADPTCLAEVFAVAVEVAAAEDLKDGYRLVVNTGRDAGQTVGHAHVHVLGGRQLGVLG